MPQELSQSLDPITDMLARIGRKGVKLWAENGQLHYRAAKGSLTDEEIEALRRNKDQLVSILERATNAVTAGPTVAISLSHSEYAELSFSQEEHWHRYKLHSSYVPRTIAAAIRMKGCVDLALLRNSIAEVVLRHRALRTRVVVCDGKPMQQVSELVDFKFEVQDLTALLPLLRDLEVKRLIEALILEPINVSDGPLWEARLLKLHSEECVLVVVMEHIISDARSLQILLRDVFSNYAQLLRGRRTSLPAIPVQFTEYAEWQKRVCDSPPGGRSSYWTTRLSGRPRVRFPDDRDLLRNNGFGLDRIHIEINPKRRASLLTWSRFIKTTPSMAVFTAYAALICRWCGVSDIVIHYVIDGRTSDKVQNTIGYFAKLLPIRVEFHKADTFVSLLKRITVEYCKAYELSDYYHLNGRIPTPDFLSNSSFNWIAQDNNNSVGESATEGAIRCSPISFEPPIPETIEVDIEPAIVLSDSGREVSGGIYFPRNRFSLARMQRFASNFGVFMDVLLERPGESVYDVALS